MKKLIFVSLIAIIITLVTCTSVGYNPDVCFQDNVLPIFVSKCSMSGCHNATDHRAGYDLSNYDGIMKGVTAKHPLQSPVYTTINGSNPSMPVGQKLDQKDISYIKIWIKMGANNSSNCNACDTTKFAYSSRIQPMLANWCVGCHNSTNSGGGYDLSTYNGVVVSITNNRLLGSLNHESGYSAMPKNTNKLSDCDLKAFTNWVNAHYPNN